MPLVIFESPTAAALEVDCPDGGCLVDVCDEQSAPVPFSCRGATCGTCRLDVLEGAELLMDPSEEELDVLAVFGDAPTRRRLACQAIVLPGKGRIRVRPVSR
jgi:2Fe-2S ferredoxin